MDPFLWNFSSRLASPPSRPAAPSSASLGTPAVGEHQGRHEGSQERRGEDPAQAEEAPAGGKEGGRRSLEETIGDARKEKAQFEKEATATASKLLDAQAKLAEEKKSEDALQGALNKLQPKSFFGLF
ncbi:unnamed protein product [Effrenium voratum]|nr:unnamed protein product [Effrenium voratum]